MTTERYDPTATADDGQDPRVTAGTTVEQSTPGAENGHDNVVRLAFQERPHYDDMLMKKHPSKVYFDAYHLYPTADGYLPVFVSSVLVDKAIRH